MPREQIEKLQVERLRWLVDYCIKNIPFYNDRLTKAGVTAEKIKSIKDIENIPYTTKEDIRDTYPFGLFGQPLKKILVRIPGPSCIEKLCMSNIVAVLILVGHTIVNLLLHILFQIHKPSAQASDTYN